MSEKGYEKIRKAVDEVKELSQNKEEWDLYVSRQRMLMDIKSGKKYEREQGIEEGRKKGIVEGKAEGKKEGEKIGTEKVAKEMLKKGMDVELISEVTKLPKEEIEKLKK